MLVVAWGDRLAMVRPLPDIPQDFDEDDRITLREVINDHRSRKAVREQLKTWAIYLGIASGVLVALAQFRDTLRSWLQIKGGGP